MENDDLHHEEIENLDDFLPLPKSIRRSATAEGKLPEHVRHCFIDGYFAPGESKKRIVLDEKRPLEDEFAVDIECGWEPAVYKVILAAENRLIREAHYLQEAAVDVLTKYRKLDNRNPVNLGFMVRVREDTFGPRVYWVKFSGKSRANARGRKTTYTDTIKLHGKYRYSSRIFSRFPVSTREELLGIEGAAASIRYRVEKLSKVRRLCLQPAEPS